MKQFKQKPIRLVESELKDDLGSGRFIFVGSGTDMFANDVSDKWIKKVLHICHKYGNKYLFQTKNTVRLINYLFPKDVVLGTTVETNKKNSLSGSICSSDRAKYLSYHRDKITMVTIEPIMDFDLKPMIDIVLMANPKWVNIGADSKRHNLPEPSWNKVEELISELSKFTEVHLKDNLKRLRSKNGTHN
jgi:protein gp37